MLYLRFKMEDNGWKDDLIQYFWKQRKGCATTNTIYNTIISKKLKCPLNVMKLPLRTSG